MKFSNNNPKPLLLMAITMSFLIPGFSNAASLSSENFGVRASADKLEQYKDLDEDAALLLGIEYRGEKFNIDKGVASYDLTNSDKYALELFGTSKNRGFSAGDSDTFEGMDKRKTSIDLGGRAIIEAGSLGPAIIEVSRDVRASDGFEAGIKLGGISPHAPHWTGERNVSVAAAAGLRYQSADVVDYYYGIKNSEATASRNAYKGKSATTPYLGLEAQANLTKHITIDGGLEVSKRASSIKDSPLTDGDDDYELGANIGFSYWF